MPRKKHIELLKAQISQNRQLVLAWTNMCPQDYNSLYYALAELFLNQQLTTDRAAIDNMLASTTFWAWWTRQYNRVDTLWIDSLEMVINTEEDLVLYRTLPTAENYHCTDNEEVLAENYRAWHTHYLTDGRHPIKHSFNTLVKSI